MDIVISRSCQPYLLFCWEKKGHFVLLASSSNFGFKVVIASRRQCQRFLFVMQMRYLFFMKFLSENADSHK